MSERSLFDPLVMDPPPVTPEDRFRAFHRANPHVYRLFCRFALQAAEKRKHFGARMIWERMRWYAAFEVVGDEEYRLNDHYPPFYARLFMADHSEHAGLFETRRRT